MEKSKYFIDRINDIRKEMINFIKEQFNKYAVVEDKNKKIFYIQNNMECINEGYSVLVEEYDFGEPTYRVDNVDYIIGRNDVLYIGERVITDLYTDELQAIVEMIENLIENDWVQDCIDAWNE